MSERSADGSRAGGALSKAYPASGQKVPRRGSKLKPDREKPRPSGRLRQDGDIQPLGDCRSAKGGDSKAGGCVDKRDKSKKAAREDGELGKSKLRMEKSGKKLAGAKEKLAAREPPKKPGALKTVSGLAGTEAWVYIHGKAYQMEEENIGVAGAHRTELAGEGAVRGAARFVKHRNRAWPARRVHELQKQDIKARADFNYRATAQEHPELKKNAASKHYQKKLVKKQYQKQAREAAKKTAKKTAEKAATAAEKTAKAILGFVKRHPVGSLIAVLIVLLLVALQSCMGSMAGIGNSLGGAVAAGTYPSEDAEILAAEDAFAGMEAALQYELDNYSRLHPGYDEYRFYLDEIWHDPYALISILSALHEGEWTLDDVQGTLDTLFHQQYTLTATVSVEVRSYVVWGIDDEGNSYSGIVYYNYYICYVALDNFNLSHLPIHIMGEEKLSRYALYMATLGNRPDLFPVRQYPHASEYKDYGRHDIPPEYLEDETFAAMIKEAEKYLGYPYVWGGYCPATSFDCSGFVSWVLNHSGWNVGRLSAQGLYGICATVSASSAKPGDLVFFHSTYTSAETVTHVGIYVGDGMILHAGNPIGYVSINTAYWQEHLYAYGRLP